ncbi:MAG: redoxin domain-containing protein [Chloroflexi bacterium]|nr:redoxin domain-containing protein [Chloroflexota bacterium]
MALQSGNDLQHVEQLLHEGKKQEALPFLAEHIRQHPDSVRGWWLLSFAIPDEKKQIECVERVLRIDPNSSRALARLEKLKGNGHTPAFVSPFVETTPSVEPAVSSDQMPTQNEQPSAPQRAAPRRKKNNQILQYAVLGVMACALVGILGFAAVVIVQGSMPMRATQPAAITQISLPPTWTPTPTVTSAATQALTATPLATATLEILPTSTIPKSQIGPFVGYYAPDFTLVNLNDNVKTRLSDHEGKAVIIFFWTTWCQFCEAQMPTVEMLYKGYKDKGLVILAVDVGESETYARMYRDSHSLTFPILDDAGRDVSSKYHVTAYPTYFFVDPSGVISSIKIGVLDYWGFDNKVKAMLGLP